MAVTPWYTARWLEMIRELNVESGNVRSTSTTGKSSGTASRKALKLCAVLATRSPSTMPLVRARTLSSSFCSFSRVLVTISLYDWLATVRSTSSIKAEKYSLEISGTIKPINFFFPVFKMRAISFGL